MFIRPPLFSSTRLGSPFPLRFASACALVFTQFRASHMRFIRLFPRPERRNFPALSAVADFKHYSFTDCVFTAEARRRGGILPSLLRSSAYSAASVFQRFWVLPFQ